LAGLVKPSGLFLVLYGGKIDVPSLAAHISFSPSSIRSFSCSSEPSKKLMKVAKFQLEGSFSFLMLCYNINDVYTVVSLFP
jgi:hypothetical protein